MGCNSSLSGKIALVTGSSQGIGRSIAEAIAAQGALTVVHYANSSELAAEVVDGILHRGGEAFALRAPFKGRLSIIALFKALDEALQERGSEQRLDILVNNAAEFSNATIERVDEAVMDRMLEVNFKAPFFAMQEAMKRMPDGGRIINISSQSAHKALPIYAIYGPCKGAIEVVTRNLAKQLGPRGITVNAIAPGLVATEKVAETMKKSPEKFTEALARNPLGRAGEPRDIADIAAFLASDGARWITGETIHATGGSDL
jgi:NAD(P)-dependent dehydrogenase (short-subunit alcohol dehydrogenase family)